MRVPKVRRALSLAALLLIGVAGCSKKVTDPNSRPVPEGQQNGQLLMMGWHEQRSVWFSILDPGTPDNTVDDVLGVEGHDFWADSAGVRTSTLDISLSNQLEAMRVGSDGNVQPMFDFPIQPTVRLIGTNLDDFDFEDFSPDPVPAYYGRGILNGQVTTASPVSNRASAFPSSDDNMNFIPEPKGAANDSVLDIQFEDVPGAVFYVAEVAGASAVLGTGDVYSNERRLIAIPSPLLPGERALSTLVLLMPGGTGATGFHFTISTRRSFWPLFFYIRVSAYDAEGRMVNRVNDYLHTHAVDSGTNIETYEPMGGAIEILDPYPDPVSPVSPPLVLTRDQAFALLESKGGGGAPHALSQLAGSAAAGITAPGFPDALRQLALSPVLSEQAANQRFKLIRQRLDGQSNALQAAPARLQRTVRPEGAR